MKIVIVMVMCTYIFESWSTECINISTREYQRAQEHNCHPRLRYWHTHSLGEWKRHIYREGETTTGCTVLSTRWVSVYGESLFGKFVFSFFLSFFFVVIYVSVFTWFLTGKIALVWKCSFWFYDVLIRALSHILCADFKIKHWIMIFSIQRQKCSEHIQALKHSSTLCIEWRLQSLHIHNVYALCRTHSILFNHS